jgi:hypothetical protein
MKKLIVFDLDGTLAESKASLDAEMAALLSNLLGIVKAAVISGGHPRPGWQAIPVSEARRQGKLFTHRRAGFPAAGTSCRPRWKQSITRQISKFQIRERIYNESKRRPSQGSRIEAGDQTRVQGRLEIIFLNIRTSSIF